MTGGLTTTDTARLARTGAVALPDESCAALFGRAVALAGPVVLPIGLDLAAAHAHSAATGAVPALLRGLLGGPVRVRRSAADAPAGSTDTGLRARLAGLGETEQATVLTGFVRAEVAVVLGHGTMDAVPPDGSFQTMGVDSLMAVELRNRLRAATGLQLPATVVFDFPTCQALATELHHQLVPSAARRPADPEDVEIALLLEQLSPQSIKDNHWLPLLRGIVADDGGGRPPEDEMDLSELVRSVLGEASHDA